VLYAYIALCDVVIRLLSDIPAHDLTPVFLGLMYFIGSAAGVAILLVRLNHQLKSHDSL